MRIHYYHNSGDERQEITPDQTSDDETSDFEFGEISNAEIEEDIVTIYSDDQHWYLTLSREELNRICDLVA